MPEITTDLIVVGAGLAGAMTTLSLARHLGPDYRITQILNTDPVEDIFYGSVTAPSAYDFLRSIGLDEPYLFQSSTTSFSYGTLYQKWLDRPAWMQSHEQPFPIIDDVPLQHHLARSRQPLQPVLMAAQAAWNGRFAHPPQEPSSALSRAEYGYQFSPAEWCALIDDVLAELPVQRLFAGITEITRSDTSISHIHLSTGECLTANLVIDCSGPHRTCITAFGAAFQTERTLAAWTDIRPAPELGPPHRTLVSTQDGWSATTHLQSGGYVLNIADTEAPATPPSCAKIALGQLDLAWVGNCVAIGQAACVLEPLSPAPMMLLLRDIERLLELIPTANTAEMERREFNRRFQADSTHTSLFNRLFHLDRNMPQTAYWRAAAKAADSDLLNRKRALFQHRGVVIKYDLEPFNTEDWTILFHGLGYAPEDYDLQIENVPQAQSERHVAGLQSAIASTVSRMPPHPVYVRKMKTYFEKHTYA